MNLTFRNAERKDTLLILQFIKRTCRLRKKLNEVVADEATLETWIFDKQKQKSFLLLKMEKRLDLRCFSKTFLRS